MSSTLLEIGGHQERPDNAVPGVIVYRDASNSAIVKQAYNEADADALRNEMRFLHALKGRGVAPEPIGMCIPSDTPNVLVETRQEDLGINEEEPQDGELFRQSCVNLLWELRQANIRHGDLTGANIIVRGSRVWAIDFQQSHFFNEPAPEKRTLADSYYLWRYCSRVKSKAHPHPDTPRVARRWAQVQGELGGNAQGNPLAHKTFLDLGCFQGDFVAMAAAEGMEATGVDKGGFRTGENSIEIGNQLFGYMVPNFNLMQADIGKWMRYEYNVVMMFSTWAYYVIDYGLDAAHALLARIMSQCGVLFFETQLAGDGPGPKHLVTDDDVGNMLGAFGNPKPCITIPVVGRPASRTVWMVRPL